MNLTGKQVIGIVIAVLSVLMVSTAQLQDLFGPTLAKAITSVAGLLNAILGSALATITSQAATVRDASNTTGVEPIRINKDAPQSIAALAVDPTMNNIEAKQSDAARVATIAQTGG